MDQTTYERWWQLHLQAARGGTLDPTERALYEAGLDALDPEEQAQWADTDLALLRQLRAEVERLETSHAQLQARSQRLDRQVTLEGAYMSLTGFELGKSEQSGLRLYPMQSVQR